MANEKQKCPICGTKLKMINGRMTCKECGYYVRNSSDYSYDSGYQSASSQSGYSGSQSSYGDSAAWNTTTQSTTSQNTTSQNTTSQNTTSQNSIPQNTAAPRPVPAGTPSSPYTDGSRIAKRVAIVVAVLISINLISGAIVAFMHLGEYSKESQASQSARESKSSGSSKPSKSSSSTGSAGSTQSGSESDFLLPESSFFQELSEVIFAKDLSDITQEEFASVTAIEIDFYEKEIYYQLDYVDGIPLTFGNSYGIKLSDLRCFSGLEWISLIGQGLKAGDLDGLEQLYAMKSKNTVEELAKIIPHPENITELYVTDTFADDLEGIQNFSNLQYLTVDYGYLSDISALSQIPQLLGLALLDCDDLTDFRPLKSMNSLEKLSIQCSTLKSIDFVSDMPNLTYLSIEGSAIPNIDAVRNCPNLEGLYLVENYSVPDYAPVADLVNLTDLTIYKQSDARIPSLEKLTNLESASFRNLHEGDLALVTAASNIRYLYLDYNYDLENLNLLTNLPLISLSMTNCSFYGNDPLEPLTKLPKLAYLDLSHSYVFGNIDDLFGIPTLEYLNLKEATGVIDFEHLPSNENLLVLNLSGLKIKTESYGSDVQNISDHYDMFENFPNVEELYLASLGIDSIEFVSYMPSLYYLDIINNNVTSLKPLENLPFFETVLCGRNTILDSVSEDSGIYVDTETQYYSYK